MLEGKPRIVLNCNGGRFLHNIIRHIFLPNFSCELNFKKNSTLYENISQQIHQDTLYSLSGVFNEIDYILEIFRSFESYILILLWAYKIREKCKEKVLDSI